MAWCPKCKNEYVEGITHCADCNVDLVDELVEEKDVQYINLNNVMEFIDDMDDLIDYLHKASIESAEFVYIEDEDLNAISVDKKQYEDARLHVSVYLQNEASNNASTQMSTDDENISDEEFTESAADNGSDANEISVAPAESEILGESDDMEGAPPILSSTQKEYTRLSVKYEDVKSSGYTLLLVGIVGAIALLLEIFEIYTFPISQQTKWLFYTVMGGIFIAFIISGVASMMHAAQLKIDATKEDELIDEILAWFKENHTKDSIDSEIDIDTREELLYFNRGDYIKNSIMHQFENADEQLVDSLIEDIYADIFEA